MKKPNIVFVLTDDQGYGDLGCTGNPIIKTPNIDKFYSDSYRFTNYHVGPTCAPTRAGLMTGHYANSTGVWHTVGGRSLLRADEWTLASALQDGGYNTGIFGKWHLGDTHPYRPQERGFGTTVTHGGGGISQAPDFWGNDYFDDTYSVNGELTKFDGYCTDVFFREATKFIKESGEEPFFCYIACNAPHEPFNVEKRYYEMYKDKTDDDRARFYGMITNIDENFGKLRSSLDDLGKLDNTILIFMTDNGTAEGITEDENQFVVGGYNAGLRGKKNSEYDGGHRVPFFMSYPDANICGGVDMDRLTANVDFMPTLLDMCGVLVPENRTFHGSSLYPMIKGEDTPSRVLVTDSQRVTDPIKWRKSAVMTDDWRLVNGEELFCINKDREQRQDIAKDHPDMVSKLRDEYNIWWDIVSQKFDETIPLHIGEVDAVITTHELRNPECITAWNQPDIRQGYVVNGYFEIQVIEDGKYEIELRRWALESNSSLTQGFYEDDIEFNRECVQPKKWNMYTGGRAIDIQYATLEIGGVTHRKLVDKDAVGVKFVLDLLKGKDTLTPVFIDSDGIRQAPYYTYIKKIG